MAQNREIIKYRDKYLRLFGQNFPNEEVKVKNDEEEVEAIKKCLSASKPAKIVFNIDYRNDY